MYEKMYKKNEIVENFTRTPCLFPEKWYTDIVSGRFFLECCETMLQGTIVHNSREAVRKRTVFFIYFL